uniref:Hexosyltransferase n=1 Tax=Physcomitrium patens TaxID=3218 RepID=A0A2K1L8N3_PHYPA|nr:hypothetical protein PHYPA_000801 [Physcomitrium patens]
MWRLLPPWLIFNNGSIVSFWPCIPGSHRYTLGLRTSMCTLVKQPPTTEVADCHHDRSTQLWLTALSFSIIFSIFLLSIAVQDFTVGDTTSKAQPQLPLNQRIYIGFSLKTRGSSSLNVIAEKLGHFFGFRRFNPNSFRSKQRASTTPVKIPSFGSALGKPMKTEPGGEHQQPSAQQATQSSSGFKTDLLPNLISNSNKGIPWLPSNANCGHEAQGSFCNESLVHIAMTLDANYLRGSMAAIYSILLHAECASNVRFHFVATKEKEELEKEPLNYARFYLAHMIDSCVKRIIYLDLDVLVLGRIEELWMTNMGNSTVGTPEYCHANFPSYFTENFWINSSLASTFANKQPCYFNSGMMLINLERWRKTRCTSTLEYWMEVQKQQHIYELGSLPPLLLTFAGSIQAIDNRWNQHGLGGDIVKGDCRPTRNEPAS